MAIHQKYMQRCLELAKLGAGHVAPNPMVGAILVHDDKIIGEGWHQQYGEAHAEVNCIASVKKEDQDLIAQSTLYVSLEPCAHFGKTAPCADLIIQHKIQKVVIGCRDPFKEVDARLPACAGTDRNDAVGQGKGIEKLNATGVTVEVGLLEKECKELNKRFFTFHTQHRPYIILKWAQTADGKMAAPLNPPQGGTLHPDSIKVSSLFENFDAPPCEVSELGEGMERSSGEAFSSGEFNGAHRLLISNEFSNRLVHKWRSEEAAILVGTNTAMLDDPELTTRLWTGPSPVRLVVDMDLKLPSSLKIFTGEIKTIIFNSVKQEEKESLLYYKLEKDKSLVAQLMKALYQLKIQSVLVEGGARMLQSFIDEEVWDEVRTVTSLECRVTSGLSAPILTNAIKTGEQMISTDKIEIYKQKNSG